MAEFVDSNLSSDLSASDILSVARRVIATEREAVADLLPCLDENFASVVKILAEVTGQIIITGMGKSGHIGRKIAATLVSTGAPAVYVHPAEASHGDLGMIRSQDVVLAMSNSGKTPELHDIIFYTRRYGIRLIALTSGADSTLTQNADHVLLLPKVPEACPMGLAPTSSTTIALVMGDALAVSMLEYRRFTPRDFQRFHPGGVLGQALLSLADVMHRGDNLPLLPIESTMAEAVVEMSRKSLGCVGILAPEGSLAGIVTDGDLRRWVEKGGKIQDAVSTVMTRNAETMPADASIAEALRRINTQRITGVFVCDSCGRPQGFVHVHDCLRLERAAH